ncbi:MAG: hypothetical protein AAGA60_16830 [Cyanobacteria bacterium P01_E01_bin.42]
MKSREIEKIGLPKSLKSRWHFQRDRTNLEKHTLVRWCRVPQLSNCWGRSLDVSRMSPSGYDRGL